MCANSGKLTVTAVDQCAVFRITKNAHTLGEIFTQAQLRVLDFKNRNS